MKKLGIILAALLVAVSFSFTSCDLFKELLSIGGKVVNIKADPNGDFFKSKTTASLTLAGATVTFTNTSDATKKYTATVKSDGTYSITGVPSGKYTITGTQNGWTFIPITMVVSGMTLTAPNLLAFATTEAGTLTVVLTWENKDTDMDLHMTYDTLGVSTSNNHVFYNAKTKTGTNFTATLDRDVTGSLLTSQPLVETITLTATGGIIAPSQSGATSATVPDNNTFRFYIDAFSKTSGTTGDSSAAPAVSPAGATVHVFQGATHLGTFFAPFNTAEQTLRIMRVAFDGTANNGFTVFTDVQSEPAGTFRGLDLPLIGKLVSAIE